MYKQIKVQVYECHCERCGYDWKTFKLRVSCARCKTRSWNVKKKNAI